MLLRHRTPRQRPSSGTASAAISRKQQACRRADAEIGEPAASFRGDEPAPRQKELDQCEQDEEPGEHTEPHHRIVEGKCILHRGQCGALARPNQWRGDQNAARQAARSRTLKQRGAVLRVPPLLLISMLIAGAPLDLGRGVRGWRSLGRIVRLLAAQLEAEK